MDGRVAGGVDLQQVSARRDVDDRMVTIYGIRGVGDDRRRVVRTSSIYREGLYRGLPDGVTSGFEPARQRGRDGVWRRVLEDLAIVVFGKDGLKRSAVSGRAVEIPVRVQQHLAVWLRSGIISGVIERNEVIDLAGVSDGNLPYCAVVLVSLAFLVRTVDINGPVDSHAGPGLSSIRRIE